MISIFRRLPNRKHYFVRVQSCNQNNSQWTASKVRSSFIEYFENKRDHTHFKSSPVVPHDDPTLLFANAGMNQFKPMFIGTVDPKSTMAPLLRVVNSQKCIRAGGKHNDLEDVGKDTYHHTFFEMLGTWSFGNYFKIEAIDWAFDILINTYGISKDRLYVTYFGGDESQGIACDLEARDCWLKYLPVERVLPFDKKANFWEMGDTGPCGPCSEIHFDRIGNRDASHLVNADDPNVLEIWNLVFMQYNREPGGLLKLLPSRHIDTGMGLERLVSVLQKKPSNYDTDVFVPIFEAIQRITGSVAYGGRVGSDDAEINYRDTAYRVVADHVRTLAVAISDGAVPGKEGRGYVIRRVLRRAMRYSLQTLGAQPGFLAELIPIVIAQLGMAFPELKANEAKVVAIVREEELAFAAQLASGQKLFESIVQEMPLGSRVIPGHKAFFLYDSCGFPLDLTQIMAAEKGLTVNVREFEQEMTSQKLRSRAAAATAKARQLSGSLLTLGTDDIARLNQFHISSTDDSYKYQQNKVLTTNICAIKYSSGELVPLLDDFDCTLGTILTNTDIDQLERLRQLSSDSDQETVGIIMQSTSFYSSSGGQSSDIGFIVASDSNNLRGSDVILSVLDCKSFGGYVLHTCVPLTGIKSVQDYEQSVTRSAGAVRAVVDTEYRLAVTANHTATHVLNFGLRNVLGDGVEQCGSMVNDDKFRFDFSLNRSLTFEEIEKIEIFVNNLIQANWHVECDIMALKEAQAISGIRAVFGESYPDPVRVVRIGKVSDVTGTDSSMEFCGGTHLNSSAEALAFVVLDELAVAKGTRRIVAATRQAAQSAVSDARVLQSEISQLLSRAGDKEVLSSAGSISNLLSQHLTLRQRVDQAVISCVTKNIFRSELEAVRKLLAPYQSQHSAALLDSIMTSAALEYSKHKDDERFVVLKIDVTGLDSKHFKKLSEELRKITQDKMSVLCVCVDKAVDKIFVVAIAPSNIAQSISANDWVISTLQSCGGKGGGKQNHAHGSVDSVGNVDLLIEAAVKFGDIHAKY